MGRNERVNSGHGRLRLVFPILRDAPVRQVAGSGNSLRPFVERFMKAHIAILIAASSAFAFDSFDQSQREVRDYTEEEVLREMAATILMGFEAIAHKDYERIQFCNGRLVALNNRWQHFRAQREQWTFIAPPPGAELDEVPDSAPWRIAPVK
jgi:hypothetical protein